MRPKKGQEIYVPPAYYVYRGEDDFVGGLATISKVEVSTYLPEDHINSIMVGVDENPHTMYNYRILMEEQEKLKEQFGKQRAYPDPDYREEFNCSPNADWQ